MIVFSNKKKTPTSAISLTLNNQAVQTVNSIRYLGVILDSKLSWKLHRNTTLQNAKQNLIAISQKIAKTWGPKPYISKWIYTGMIRPKILYASMNWGHTLKTQKVKNQYDKLNRIALMMITPTRKSISTSSLEIIHDLIPLDLMIQKTGLASHRRLRDVVTLEWSGYNKSKTKTSHLRHWENLKLECNLHHPNTDKIKHLNWGRKYKINEETFGSNYDKSLIHSQYTVYTDGSKTKTGAGAGYFFFFFFSRC